MADLRAVRREAVFKAEMVLAEHEIGPAGRVRIFDLIEDDGVWLTFEPLERLYGCYQRTENAAGIVINASHPVSLQRFTAAHELGHHVLGHTSSIDDEASVIDGGQGADPQEVAAHVFAANLLMPLAAVEFHLARLGLDRRRPQVSPVTAYQLSVELGVSYLAAVVQLASLNKIDWNAVATLRKERPLTLKRELVGRAPDYSRAAVWSLGESDDGRHLFVDIGDELHVRLSEIRSTGHRWTPTKTTLEGFALVENRLVPTGDSVSVRYGAAQERHLVLKATTPGPHSILFDLRPAWDEDAVATRRVAVAVDIEAPRVGALGRGVSVNQQPQLVAA